MDSQESGGRACCFPHPLGAESRFAGFKTLLRSRTRTLFEKLLTQSKLPQIGLHFVDYIADGLGDCVGPLLLHGMT
jgi:hypothetical protein